MAASFSFNFLSVWSQRASENCVACQNDVFLTFQTLSKICGIKIVPWTGVRYQTFDFENGQQYTDRLPAPGCFPLLRWVSHLPLVTHRFGCFHVLREEKKAVDWKGVRGYSSFCFCVLNVTGIDVNWHETLLGYSSPRYDGCLLLISMNSSPS